MFNLFTDGGSRGNPGPAATGFFIFEGNILVDFGGEYLGEATNNVAEYKALILGLKTSLKTMIRDITCHLDSELIVKQLNGEYKVKDANMKMLFDQVVELREKFDDITFVHVPRAENKYADRMVNVILDSVQK